MSITKNIYECFNWPGAIWFYSDPHFSDKHAYRFRGNCMTDEEQIRRINSKVSKNDTLVILGDIGNIKMIKRLHGYKVLILGNHDAGASNYRRFIKDIVVPYSSSDAEFIKTFDKEDVKYSNYMDTEFIEIDNKLFDEVYTGCLMINDKIILSHEPVDFPFAFNIHGHDHAGQEFNQHVLGNYDCDIPTKNLSDIYLKAIKEFNLKHLNVCAEIIGYYPVCLSSIVKSGVLKTIPNIHRVTIDAASENKIKNSLLN